jgi:hypothetical protein
LLGLHSIEEHSNEGYDYIMISDTVLRLQLKT